MLLSLNLLAFLFHSVLDLANSTYKKVRNLSVSRRSLKTRYSDITKVFLVCNLARLVEFILTDNVPNSTSNSS